MSAQDIPLGHRLLGLGPGELAAPARRRRFATFVLAYCIVAGAAVVLETRHAPLSVSSHVAWGVSLFCILVACVGAAVRRARVRLDATGVSWGWGELGFRVSGDRIERVVEYREGVAVYPHRRGVWFLSQRDWHGIGDALLSLGDPDFTVERAQGRAPLRARLQGYGAFLDGILALVGVLVSLVVAAVFVL